MKYWMLTWVTILTNIGRYSGIVWGVNSELPSYERVSFTINPCHKKNYRGQIGKELGIFVHKKRGSRFGSLSFANGMQNMEINGACCHSSAASAVADPIIVVGVLDLAFADS